MKAELQNFKDIGSLLTTIKVPKNRPGCFPKAEKVNYNKLIQLAVRKKFDNRPKEDKEAWYGKLAAVRRGKTARLHVMQDGRCIFCQRSTFVNEDTREGRPKGVQATLDHIVPQCRGGTDHMSNLVMACMSCNNLRGDMGFKKFVKLRSSPELWGAHIRRMAVAKEPKQKELTEKKLVKRVAMIERLTLLFYIAPEWIPVGQAIVDEFKRRREAVEQKRLDRIAKSPLGDPDILVDSKVKPANLAA